LAIVSGDIFGSWQDTGANWNQRDWTAFEDHYWRK
jgi:hypothetical protein